MDKKPKKKGFGTKLKEAFFGENVGDGSIADNIFFKIFIPKLKMVLSEMANSAINSALGLDNRTRTFNGGVNGTTAGAACMLYQGGTQSLILPGTGQRPTTSTAR